MSIPVLQVSKDLRQTFVRFIEEHDNELGRITQILKSQIKKYEDLFV